MYFESKVNIAMIVASNKTFSMQLFGKIASFKRNYVPPQPHDHTLPKACLVHWPTKGKDTVQWPLWLTTVKLNKACVFL